MFTKCPICGTSDHVTCLNTGKKVLATTAATLVGGFAQKVTRRPSSPLAMQIYKNICPEGEYYCKKCKHYFKVSTF